MEYELVLWNRIQGPKYFFRYYLVSLIKTFLKSR